MALEHQSITPSTKNAAYGVWKLTFHLQLPPQKKLKHFHVVMQGVIDTPIMGTQVLAIMNQDETSGAYGFMVHETRPPNYANPGGSNISGSIMLANLDQESGLIPFSLDYRWVTSVGHIRNGNGILAAIYPSGVLSIYQGGSLYRDTDKEIDHLTIAATNANNLSVHAADFYLEYQ